LYFTPFPVPVLGLDPRVLLTGVDAFRFLPLLELELDVVEELGILVLRYRMTSSEL